MTAIEITPVQGQSSRRTQWIIWVVVGVALLTAVGGLLQIPGLLS